MRIKTKLRIIILSVIFLLFCYWISYAEIPGPLTKEIKENKDISASLENKSSLSVPGAKNKFIFSFGLGGGVSLLSYQAYSSENKDKYLNPCFSSNFRLGFAPSDKYFICWNARTNFFRQKSDEEYPKNDWLAGGGAGLGVTFFPFKNRPSLYLNCLFGYSNLFQGFDYDINNFGTEAGFGLGYVFMDHFSSELNLQLGTSERSHYDGTIRNPMIINFTLNYIFWKQ